MFDSLSTLSKMMVGGLKISLRWNLVRLRGTSVDTYPHMGDGKCNSDWWANGQAKGRISFYPCPEFHKAQKLGVIVIADGGPKLNDIWGANRVALRPEAW